jgi:hypothetical protein
VSIKSVQLLKKFHKDFVKAASERDAGLVSEAVAKHHADTVLQPPSVLAPSAGQDVFAELMRKKPETEIAGLRSSGGGGGGRKRAGAVHDGGVGRGAPNSARSCARCRDNRHGSVPLRGHKCQYIAPNKKQKDTPAQ